MKKLLVALLMLLVLSFVGLAACGTNGNGSSEPDVPPAPVEKEVEISATSKTLKLFEGYSLSVTADGEIVTAEWSSSNEQVATVLNGVVTAKHLGNATVTAEFEQKTYSCVIEVVEPDVVPALTMDQTATVYIGTDKPVSVTCVYNGEPNEITDLAFTVADKTVAEATAQEGGFTVKGLKAGETVITVSADWHGVILLGEITVTVADPVSLSLSAATATVYKYSDSEHSATARIIVTEVLSNGAVVENPVIDWTSDDEQIATVADDGTITAVGIGSTLINATYTEGEKQYVAYCQVTVAYNVKTLTDAVNLYANKDCVIDLSETYGDDLGDVAVADKLVGDEIEHTRDGNVYTLTASGLTVGNQRTLVLSYESGLKLEIPVNVYDLLITTKAELLQFRSDIENYKNVILGAEIDLESDGFGRIATTQAEGETQTEANANAKTFNGTFEGNGYAIKNGNYGGVGLFQNIGENAVVKNVNFQGATLHSWSADSTYRTSTVFANDIFGTVKNVLIDCSVIRHLNANWAAGQYGTAFACGIKATANVSNVIVYWKTKYFLDTTGGQSQWGAKRTACTSFVAQEGVGSISKDATVSNLYSFNKTHSDGQDGAVPGSVENASAVTLLDYDTACAAAELSSKGFDSLWVFSGTMASMKNYDQLNAETFKIYTAADLLTFRANITSYNRVELMNDIDLGTNGFGKIADTLEVGETQTEPNVKAKTFMGFFEGNGYKIKNGNYGGVGLFQNIGAGAVVQNVAFEGATLHSWSCASEDDYRCSSIFANHVYGTVKNVVIDCVVDKHNNANGAGGNYGTAFATTIQAGANVSNVIVYFRTGRVVRSDAYVYHTDTYSSGCTTFVGNAGVGSISSAATVSNLYSFNKTYSNGQDKALNPSSEGADKVIVKDYNDTCAAAGLTTATGFDSIWNFSGDKAALTTKSE